MYESPHKLLIIIQEKATLVKNSGRYHHNQMNKLKKNYEFIPMEREREREKVNGAKYSYLLNLGKGHTGVLCTTLAILLKFEIMTKFEVF